MLAGRVIDLKSCRSFDVELIGCKLNVRYVGQQPASGSAEGPMAGRKLSGKFADLESGRQDKQVVVPR